MSPFFTKRSNTSVVVSRTLYDIAQGFDSPFESETRLRRAQKLMRRIVPYHQCALLETTAGESQLLIEPDSWGQREVLSPLMARILAVLKDDAKRGAETGAQSIARLQPVVSPSYLAVPIIALDRVLGVFYVRDGKTNALSDEHLQIMSVVASQIAAYLASCQLHKQDEQIAREHKAAREVAAAENRAKDEFLAMLGHELHNPVLALRNTLQTIRQQAIGNAEIQQATDAAAQQVKHLEWLLDDILDVSRLTHGKITLRKQPITLRAIVTDALAATRSQIEARGQVISLTLPEAPLCFAADPIRLVQVFGNLLDNASKYSPRGGTISVTGYGESGDVVVRVRDTGIGIARDMLPRVFNLFVQNDPFLVRSEDGLGVGLTLARKLVELHRGSIAAESEGLGRGSEFVVRLPVCDPAAAVNLPPLA